LLDLPHRTHTILINYIVQDIPIAEQLFKRLFKFVKSCIISNNANCKLAVNLALNGSNSVICRNINFICEKYNLDKCFLDIVSLGVYTENDDELVKEKANTIRDYLLLRNSFHSDSEDFSNLSAIINSLCED